jgi:hypothetical protein
MSVGVGVGPVVGRGLDVGTGVLVHVGAGIGVYVGVIDAGKTSDAPTGIAVPTDGATSKLPAITQRLATVISAKMATTIKPSAR